jgi:acetyl/propionyl-CoA carboxylase alpha subunit
VRKVLIANRGEIAVRIARACRDAGLASVAVYAAPLDREAVHVQAADEAVPLDGATPAETYLDMASVLRAAASTGADALHPGHGARRRPRPTVRSASPNDTWITPGTWRSSAWPTGMATSR